MSRTIIPLQVADLSQFAKALRAQLVALDHQPVHSELLTLLSRAAGYRNYQHLKALAEGAPPAEPQPDRARVEKVARYFDTEGRMTSWPARLNHQELCFWVMWSRLPAGETLSESEISNRLKSWHLFGDHALLRRGMVDGRLLTRTQDGREYRRVERQPPVELRALLQRIAPPLRVRHGDGPLRSSSRRHSRFHSRAAACPHGSRAGACQHHR